MLPWGQASQIRCHSSSALERVVHCQGCVRDFGDVRIKHRRVLTLESHSPAWESCVLTVALHFHNWKMEIVTGVRIK